MAISSQSLRFRDRRSVVYTEEQELIIRHKGGHAKVSAVAGSGKTTAMVGHVIELLESGTPAHSIQVLMFNRTARDSFYWQLREEARGMPTPRIRTFHALAYHLINQFTEAGLMPKLKLATDCFSNARLLRRALTRCGMHISPRDIDDFNQFQELVKSSMVSVQEQWYIQNSARSDRGDTLFPEIFITAFERYETYRVSDQIRFFSDLIHDCATLLSQDFSARQLVQHRLSHIIIDEFQDINAAQMFIIKVLAGTKADIMAVGDSDQCVYEWQGAEPEYLIRDFEKEFKQVTHYQLSRTFRYGHTLALAANHCIRNNTRRDDIVAISAPGAPETKVQVLPDKGAASLHGVIRHWQGRGNRLRDCLVLVRINASALALEFRLLESGIPYRLHDMPTLFDNQIIRALSGYLRLLNGSLYNRKDAYKIILSMLSYPRLYLSNAHIKSIAAGLVGGGDASAVMEWLAPTLPASMKGRLVSYAQGWDAIRHLPLKMRVDKALAHIAEVMHLQSFAESNFNEVTGTLGNERIFTALHTFAEGRPSKSIEAFLSLLDNESKYQAKNNNDEDQELPPRRDEVQIATVHKVKGMESPMVILADLEEGVFPHRHSLASGDELESERRLFYVGITRASQELYLFTPKVAEEGSESDGPVESRFVSELKLASSRTCAHAIAHNDLSVFDQADNLLNHYLREVKRDVNNLHAQGMVEPPPEVHSDMGERGTITTHRKPVQPSALMAHEVQVTGGKLQGLVWQGMRVSHGVYGLGTIAKVALLPEHGEFIQVQFDSGKAYNVPSGYIELRYHNEAAVQKHSLA
ncbi:MAG: ATP-dependent helicase [Sedimenticola sp.]